MDNLFIRLAVVLLLGYVGYEAFRELRKPDREEYLASEAGLAHKEQLVAAGELAEGMDIPDALLARKIKNSAKLLTLFVILSIGLGVVFLKWILPMIGDKVGEAFYSSGEKIQLDDNAKAMALVTQGRYEDAIAAFQKLIETNPTDRFPVVEIAKLQQEKLDDVDAAMQTYSEALQRGYPDDDSAFFMVRLADMYYSEKKDTPTAKQYLHEVIQRFPGTNHAGAATHKLREIEEAEFLASHGQG